MKREIISVIVPVYNVEQYLERCINSILNQTYQNLEIILVDDGSTDDSGEMCDKFAARDTRIKVVHKPNGGLSDARNAGLAVATGAFIGFVDSDDWIEPDMYQKMYEQCMENHADIAICKYASEYKDHTVADETKKIVILSQNELLRAYIGDYDTCVIYNSVWSKLFRKEIVENELFPVGRNSEDIMYTTKAFCKAKKAVYMDCCFYHYVLDRDGSIMNDKQSVRMFRDEIPFWREHIAYINEKVSSEMGDYAAYYFYRRMLLYFSDLIKTKSGKEAARKIATMMRQEKTEVLRVYKSCPQSHGDVARMRIFLISPTLYRRVDQTYIKLRNMR